MANSVSSKKKYSNTLSGAFRKANCAPRLHHVGRQRWLKVSYTSAPHDWIKSREKTLEGSCYPSQSCGLAPGSRRLRLPVAKPSAGEEASPAGDRACALASGYSGSSVTVVIGELETTAGLDCTTQPLGQNPRRSRQRVRMHVN